VTFALGAWPALALLAAAGGLAWWLFRLKVRPPRRIVPSLVLWRRVVQDARELSWWERVRRVVSMAATVLIAVALALAISQPGPRTAGGPNGRLLIVLDASWSMRARTPDGGTRWDRAVSGARALARSASGEVAIATTADGLVEGPTADTALLSTALDGLAPAGGADQVWPHVDGVAATHFFTDGALVRPVAAGTVIHSVFRSAPNVAITAFGVRPATSMANSPSAYLEVANYADTPQRLHLTVARGRSVVVDRWIDLGPEEISPQVLPLDASGGATLRARIGADRNALDVDDEAVAWLPSGDPITVLVVSDQPQRFADLFARDPGVRATFVPTAGYRTAAADVVIFDRWAPASAPAAPALYFAPPDRSWLASPGRDELAPEWAASEPHPVLDGVDPLPLDIVRARGFEQPTVKPIARSARGTPLVSVLDGVRGRGVIVGFGLEESNLASVTAFPVIVGNALDWLARPAAGEIRAPGPIELPASTTRVTSPDGESLPLVRAGDRVLARLHAPGLYLVQAGGAESVVGVNVGSPAIGNLMRTTLSEADRESPVGTVSGVAWWMYAVTLVFALLLVEWMTWQRRITV
jgi:hypothetical protein